MVLTTAGANPVKVLSLIYITAPFSSRSGAPFLSLCLGACLPRCLESRNDKNLAAER